MITMVMVIQTKADDEVCNLKFPDSTQLAGIWNIWFFQILRKNMFSKICIEMVEPIGPILRFVAEKFDC